MRPSSRVPLTVAMSLVVVACSRDPKPTPAPTPAPAPATTPAPAAMSEAAGPAALDRMDLRKPLPLLPMMANHQKQNMRDHLAAVQAIVAALAKDDLAAVATATSAIGFSESMGQMCEHMGAGAAGFTEQALAFHHQADRIAVAARAGDRAGVLTELGVTLSACTSCHATWKQQVVDEATYTRVTGAAPPMHGGH